jgi:hypothetical protein
MFFLVMITLAMTKKSHYRIIIFATSSVRVRFVQIFQILGSFLKRFQKEILNLESTN